MAEEEQEQKKSMIETIRRSRAPRCSGPPGGQEEGSRSDSRCLTRVGQSSRNEKIMKDFEDSVNHDPKSIGERIEGH